MGYMTFETLRGIVEETFNMKFNEDVDTFEKIEKALHTNMDVITKSKTKPIFYESPHKYMRSIVFKIETEKTGEIMDMHKKLGDSCGKYDKTLKEDQEIREVKKELGICNCWVKDKLGIVRYLLHEAFKYFKFDDIEDDEYKWLNLIGMKAKLYASKCGFIAYYDYDVNSMYPFILAISKYFLFPMDKGREIEIDSIDDIDKKQLGIYKLKILSEVDERIFMKSEAYTNYDIMLLDKIGYKYKLASKTAYVYDKYDHGYKYFDYLEKLYDIRKTSKHPSIIKDIMASTGGMCSQRNKVKINMNMNFVEMTDEEFESAIRKEVGHKDFMIYKYDFENNRIVVNIVNEPVFSFQGLARINYFLTSYARLYLGKILISNENIQKSLVYVHTDGFRCKVPPEEMDMIGAKIGQLKYVKLDGKFKITNLNCMEYYNEIEKKWEFYKKDKFEEYKKIQKK